LLTPLQFPRWGANLKKGKIWEYGEAFFKCRLIPGAEKLPIDVIFGTPIKREIRGFPVYTTGFNLSS